MELHLRLEDAEKLRLYAQSAVSKHHALEDGLSKANARAKHWERKAEEGTKRITGIEKERDEAKEEAQIARLATIAPGDTKVREEDDLARLTSLLLEIGAAKD